MSLPDGDVGINSLQTLAQTSQEAEPPFCPTMFAYLSSSQSARRSPFRYSSVNSILDLISYK